MGKFANELEKAKQALQAMLEKPQSKSRIRKINNRIRFIEKRQKQHLLASVLEML